MFSLTIVFFYEYARGHFVLNGRVTFPGPGYFAFPFPVSRATGSCTRTFPFPVLRVSSYLYRCTDMDSRLVSGYLFTSRFPLLCCWLVHLRYSLTSFLFHLVDSSMLTFTAYVFPFVVCRLVSRLVIFGLWLVIESFPFLVSLYLYLAYRYIYGLEMWVIPHLQSTLQPP